MNDDSRGSTFLEHVTLYGDSMLLTLLVAAGVGAVLGSLLTMVTFLGLNQGVVTVAGLAMGVLVGITAGPGLAWFLHGRRLDMPVYFGIALGAFVVVGIAGGMYWASVAGPLEGLAAERPVAIGALALAAVALAVMAVDSARHLFGRMPRRRIDVIRLVALAIVVLPLAALIALNPDFGVSLVVVGPLALAGFAVSAVTDGVVAIADRTATAGSRHRPTAA